MRHSHHESARGTAPQTCLVRPRSPENPFQVGLLHCRNQGAPQHAHMPDLPKLAHSLHSLGEDGEGLGSSVQQIFSDIAQGQARLSSTHILATLQPGQLSHEAAGRGHFS